MFNMSSNSFFKSVFSKQKDVDALSDMGVEPRKEMFSAMLSIDQIKDAWGKAKGKAEDMRKEKNSKEEELLDLDELEEKLKKLKK